MQALFAATGRTSENIGVVEADPAAGLIAGNREDALWGLPGSFGFFVGPRAHQCQLIERQFFGRVQFAGRQHKLLAHAAVFVHPNYLQRFTAVGVAIATGKTFLTIHVRLDGTPVTRPDVFHPLADLDHFHT